MLDTAVNNHVGWPHSSFLEVCNLGEEQILNGSNIWVFVTRLEALDLEVKAPDFSWLNPSFFWHLWSRAVVGWKISSSPVN